MILPILFRGLNNTKQTLPCQWNVLTLAGCSKYLMHNGIRAASSSAGSRLTLAHGVSLTVSQIKIYQITINKILIKKCSEDS